MPHIWAILFWDPSATFDCCEKSVPGTVAWEELATVIGAKYEVTLDLLHYDPKHRTVGALDISQIFLGSSRQQDRPFSESLNVIEVERIFHRLNYRKCWVLRLIWPFFQ